MNIASTPSKPHQSKRHQSEAKEEQSTQLHDQCGGVDTLHMAVSEGLDRILGTVSPITQKQNVELLDAQGRILAEDVISPINVPAYNNSAMDGYAVSSGDLSSESENQLRVVGQVLAGHPYPGELKPGECVSIMTGAQVPETLDTVIIREVCQLEQRGNETFVHFPPGARAGQNRRLAGEDLAQGSVAVRSGSRLGAAELGLIASLGQSIVSVYQPPRVAYFSTGDEIRSPGEPLAAGQIYDSNRFTVLSMLKSMGIEIIDLGVVPDNAEAIEAALLQGDEQADVVLSSGGVSLGDADYVKDTLDRLGEVNFWRLAIKPGRPLAYGHLKNSLFFGLPGNPVAVMVTFLQMVRPALLKLAGAVDVKPSQLTAICAEPIKKRPGRTEYLRGCYRPNAEGVTEVVTTGHQGSGILTSMSTANCLIVLEPERGSIEVGERVSIQPFEGLL